ncbi:hypothetical protein EV424DRAFT_104197 [Suillus variegatus]|nr:hypothetical protein EV424DRAFT_104197 [Suillus variegatus]
MPPRPLEDLSLMSILTLAPSYYASSLLVVLFAASRYFIFHPTRHTSTFHSLRTVASVSTTLSIISHGSGCLHSEIHQTVHLTFVYCTNNHRKNLIHFCLLLLLISASLISAQIDSQNFT